MDKGTVIVATKRYKPPSFSEIIRNWAENFNVTSFSLISAPHPSIGGWRKFIKTHLRKPKSERKALYKVSKPEKKLQLKKGGRGWLHNF